MRVRDQDAGGGAEEVEAEGEGQGGQRGDGVGCRNLTAGDRVSVQETGLGAVAADRDEDG